MSSRRHRPSSLLRCGPGASTAASDPLDTAVVAHLVSSRRMAGRGGRGATAQWSAEHLAATDNALRDEIAALRDQVVTLTRQARNAADRERAAVAAAREFVGHGDQRATDPDSDPVCAAADSAAEHCRGRANREETIRRGETEIATRDVELRRARARIAELERTVEAARRNARVERDIDQARLWLLVDTLTEAASGIRRELSLPPPARARRRCRRHRGTVARPSLHRRSGGARPPVGAAQSAFDRGWLQRDQDRVPGSATRRPTLPADQLGWPDSAVRSGRRSPSRSMVGSDRPSSGDASGRPGVVQCRYRDG